MQIARQSWLRVTMRIGFATLWLLCAWTAAAQGVTTTTVQGTVFLANGQPGAGTLHISWPAFSTAANQAVAAGIRRITFNVALVSQSTTAGLTLAEPLPGGAPASGAKLQQVIGFVDREGGSFYQEWSALFVLQGSQGERVFFYYPRLQTIAGAEESSAPLAKNKSTLASVLLSANFQALPVTDPLDGERIVCYRSFVPAPNALV